MGSLRESIIRIKKNIHYYGVSFYFNRNYRRLIRYEKNQKQKHKYGSGFLSSRNRIKGHLVLRDGARCMECKQPFRPVDLTIDHIKPIAMGGTNDRKNLRLLCWPCHKKITFKKREIEEWRRKNIQPTT